jgi:hypothetical protein
MGGRRCQNSDGAGGGRIIPLQLGARSGWRFILGAGHDQWCVYGVELSAACCCFLLLWHATFCFVTCFYETDSTHNFRGIKVPVSPKTDFSGLEKGSEYELLFCVIPFPYHDSNLRGIFNMSQ